MRSVFFHFTPRSKIYSILDAMRFPLKTTEHPGYGRLRLGRSQLASKRPQLGEVYVESESTWQYPAQGGTYAIASYSTCAPGANSGPPSLTVLATGGSDLKWLRHSSTELASSPKSSKNI